MEMRKLMFDLVFSMVKRLDDKGFAKSGVIPWASPVPFFGDPFKSRIATIGLNPSNREFLDSSDRELDGAHRRFHTLHSLKINSWDRLGRNGAGDIIELCKNYFSINPYDSWFKELDFILAGTGSSYYSPLSQACHLDLVPYATYKKWGELSSQKKRQFLISCSGVLADIIKDSLIEVVVLNGSSVINAFQEITNIAYHKEEVHSWMLPRKNGCGVVGYSYRGEIREILGMDIGRAITVIGFNHNIQSSFGVTRIVKDEIRRWVASTL